VLVSAVLRPEQREDRQLEVVRVAAQQRDDAVELPVREAELAMERLFRYGAQAASLAGRCDGPRGLVVEMIDPEWACAWGSP
jgi:hypothetical protein